MKKKILSIALIAMSLVSFGSMAQTVSNDNQVKTERVKERRVDKQDKRAQRNRYEGLTLTDAQKAQLTQLDNKRREARKQRMENREQSQQVSREARMAARQASDREYLEEVRAIVGPDQYVVFLENMYINGTNQSNDRAVRQSQRSDKQGVAHQRNDKNRKDVKERNNQGQRANRQQTVAARS